MPVVKINPSNVKTNPSYVNKVEWTKGSGRLWDVNEQLVNVSSIPDISGNFKEGH